MFEQCWRLEVAAPASEATPRQMQVSGLYVLEQQQLCHHWFSVTAAGILGFWSRVDVVQSIQAALAEK